jgi:hypothetical protein
MELVSLEETKVMNRLIRFFLFVVSFLIVMSSCQRSTFPPIEDLLVDATVFPPGWHADPEGPEPDPSAPFGGIKSVERTTLYFHSNTAGAFETIERFKSSGGAWDEFNNQKDSLFRTSEFQGPYEIPEELPYESRLADRFYLACWRPEYTPMLGCDYLAQYGPYLVPLNLGWDPDTMTPSELEKILLAVDDKLANYADK